MQKKLSCKQALLIVVQRNTMTSAHFKLITVRTKADIRYGVDAHILEVEPLVALIIIILVLEYITHNTCV